MLFLDFKIIMRDYKFIYVFRVKDSNTIANRQKDSNTMPMLEKTQIPSLPRVPPIQF
jgi:hypothetical protein